MKAWNLYVHVPFCAGRCAYCGFFSAIYSRSAAEAFVATVAREAGARAYESSELRTVYVGGGTPTVLPEQTLGNMIESALAPFSLSPQCEFTVEANPESVTREKLKLLESLGVNRISIGVQSFDDAVLKALGRLHDSKAAEKALAAAADVFDNVSGDIILGAPNATAETARADARRLTSLGGGHASAYLLSVEPGSRFQGLLSSGELALPDEEAQADCYEEAAREFEDAGLLRYEVSNYARPGSECRHNFACWEGESYLGLGPSAVSYDGKVRRKNSPSLETYFRRPESSESEAVALSPRERLRESAMLLLRTQRGVLRSRPEAEVLDMDAARRLSAGGLVELDPEGVRLGRRGFVVADSVIVELLWK